MDKWSNYQILWLIYFLITVVALDSVFTWSLRSFPFRFFPPLPDHSLPLSVPPIELFLNLCFSAIFFLSLHVLSGRCHPLWSFHSPVTLPLPDSVPQFWAGICYHPTHNNSWPDRANTLCPPVMSLTDGSVPLPDLWAKNHGVIFEVRLYLFPNL